MLKQLQNQIIEEAWLLITIANITPKIISDIRRTYISR